MRQRLINGPAYLADAQVQMASAAAARSKGDQE
jgi:hypothetical protein